DTPANLFNRAEELFALGLDIPTTAKITREMSALRLDLQCDLTSQGFASAVIKALKGGKDA
ncbi:MAG: hypothetical protein K2O81_02190, partial [Clostridia bacterium]|nr:hypothetical protein [Clostridia bacterium]